ncbi:MAG: hypothetical protein ACTSWY_14710 [Promethearchaeota archaeon]
MKKFPVCKACVSGSLCSSCQKKFNEGKINQFDIDLANDFLILEEEKFPELKQASFYHAVDIGDIVFLVIGQGHKPKFSEELLEQIKEIYEIPEILLIEKGSVKKMIEQIIHPAKLLGLNQIYIPTGDIENRVIILSEDKDKIRIPLDFLEKASSLIIREITKVQFE